MLVPPPQDGEDPEEVRRQLQRRWGTLTVEDAQQDHRIDVAMLESQVLSRRTRGVSMPQGAGASFPWERITVAVAVCIPGMSGLPRDETRNCPHPGQMILSWS